MTSRYVLPWTRERTDRTQQRWWGGLALLWSSRRCSGWAGGSHRPRLHHPPAGAPELWFPSWAEYVPGDSDVFLGDFDGTVSSPHASEAVFLLSEVATRQSFLQTPCVTLSSFGIHCVEEKSEATWFLFHDTTLTFSSWAFLGSPPLYVCSKNSVRLIALQSGPSLPLTPARSGVTPRSVSLWSFLLHPILMSPLFSRLCWVLALVT